MNDPSAVETHDSEVTSDKMETHCLVKNDNHKEETVKGTMPKESVSRKREASNVLINYVKRRDNLKLYDLELNVPSPQLDQEELTAQYCDFSPISKDESVSQTDIYQSDLSDSASVSDSGIDVSSKSSSPCHSFDTFLSQDDAEECTTINMDSESFDHLPTVVQDTPNFTECQNSAESPVAIYEDLNCLHLTDETVLSQNDVTEMSPPISKSLFNYVASTLYFSLRNEKVAPMPDHVLPLMKWKLSTITPVLIRELVQRCGFSLLDINTTEEWLGTWGKHLKCNAFRKIKTYQKVNHYPGSFHLGRKDKLWENYKRMQSRFGEDVFDFFPETFYLPNDLNLLKSAWEADEEKCWIIKPPASARGTGVKVIHKWSQLPKNRPMIVQRYLSDPYLINGTKFDLRIYVLISNIEPLRMYMFEDGLVRFASEKYSLSNKSLSNRFVHLTNYSINRKSSSYTSNEDGNSCQGHKWTLKTFWTYMTNSGINVEKIQESITDIIIKTVICVEGPVCRLMKTYAKSTYNCYELFGFDIMLDKNLRPWLLEVNISPSLHTRSLLDYSVKGQMVKDMLNMVGFQVPERKSSFSASCPPDYGMFSSVANKHKGLKYRCLTPAEKRKHSYFTFQYEGWIYEMCKVNSQVDWLATSDKEETNLAQKFEILNELTPDDVRCLIESEDEFNRKGAFTRIFPTETSVKYFAYFEHTRYYNLLLDAWERQYHSRREEGIQRLQELCDKKVHLQACTREPPSTVQEPVIEITVH